MASSIHDSGPALWQSYQDDLNAHRSIRNFRYWIDSGNGGRKWIAINGAPRFDNAGNFLGYRGSGSDITSEASAAMHLKMLSTVVEQSPVSVAVTDPGGVIEWGCPS